MRYLVSTRRAGGALYTPAGMFRKLRAPFRSAACRRRACGIWPACVPPASLLHARPWAYAPRAGAACSCPLRHWARMRRPARAEAAPSGPNGGQARA